MKKAINSAVNWLKGPNKMEQDNAVSCISRYVINLAILAGVILILSAFDGGLTERVTLVIVGVSAIALIVRVKKILMA